MFLNRLKVIALQQKNHSVEIYRFVFIVVVVVAISTIIINREFHLMVRRAQEIKMRSGNRANGESRKRKRLFILRLLCWKGYTNNQVTNEKELQQCSKNTGSLYSDKLFSFFWYQLKIKQIRTSRHFKRVTLSSTW